MLSKESAKLLLRVYEALLCIYIVIAPINNALNDRGIYAVVGYASMLVLFVGTPCGLFGNAFGAEKKLGGIFTALYLAVAFAVAGTLLQIIQYHGATQILIFAQFISLSRRVNLKKIFTAFYISAIIAAIFTVTLGWVSSAVSRTAASVDGSIAVATLAITLFAQEDFERTRFYNYSKIAALVSGLVVAFFGMSRSRLLLIGIMALIKLIVFMRSSATSGRISQSTLLLIPIGLVVIVLALRMNVTQQLLREIELRYEQGFEDRIRELEAEAGWALFKKSWMFGRGWRRILYKLPTGYMVYNNHNMYVTILLRGGIVLGATMLYNFICMIKRVIERKNILAFVLLLMFFALGYGNAGAFNYTICSMMIPLAILLDREDKKPAEEEVTHENDLYSQG